ncbi:MAG: 1,4-alpha-glucan branching enzyme, partial [Rivularia sp. ALOHA_DT_140]|nr:1,4-alpha-glucan branching enzyme [Rivularia sp. ALOHA_DT_140]
MSMTTIAPEQVNSIIWNQHDNPFEILGSHKIEKDGKSVWVVRAYLPNANAAWVVLPEERKQEQMQSVHDPHFFECIINTKELANYQLKVKEEDQERVFYDAYAFNSPKLTEFDLHLFNEGNHHRIYEKLGAHPAEIKGVKGVYFAVWAPNARNVSVLGDFNNWDGRKHQMRKGSTGVWELFIPEVKVGEHYKYEIKNSAGHIYEKSDPYGFAQEVRPKTASIVTDLDTYKWNDSEWMEKRRHTDPLSTPISVYEVHLGSWLHAGTDEPHKLSNGESEAVVQVSELNTGARFLTYRELAAKLIPYVKDL